MEKQENNGMTVIVRNSSGVKIRYPDGRVEGQVTVSAERHAMLLEGLNRLHRERAMAEDAEAMV